ncbi:MAG: hypothetical protein WBD55_10145 [Dehalococcoidia bacterium]
MTGNVEEVARSRADAVVSNDFGATLRLMTHDAFGKAMDLDISTWDYDTYELEPRGTEGDDRVFVVTFHGKEGTLVLRDRFRLIDGTWKLVDIDLVG